MQCKHCGQTIDKDSNFCAYCGTQTRPHSIPPIGASQSQSTNANPYLNRGKEISKGYIDFVRETLKGPIAMAEKSDMSHYINGLITIILFSLIWPLGFYIVLRIKIPYFGDSLPFLELVIYPFIFFVVFFACLVGTLYFTIQKIIGTSSLANEISSQEVVANDPKSLFQSVVARFGVLLVVPLILVIVSILLLLLEINKLALIITLFILLAIFITIPLMIYSSKKSDKSNLDVYYAVLINYVVVFLLFYIFMSVIFEEVSDLFKSLF